MKGKREKWSNEKEEAKDGNERVNKWEKVRC